MTLLLASPAATVLVPDGASLEAACQRVVHLGIGAHPDDLEILAITGILEGARDGRRGFAGVTCADGAGSPRTGPFAATSDEEMVAIRRREQEDAARIGSFGLLVQLGLPSAIVKSRSDDTLDRDLGAVLRATRPELVYTHALTDRHDTHVAVALATLRACRAQPPDARPRAVYGCEVWGSLDWLPDARKVRLPVDGNDELCRRLLTAHASQIAGGKRYDDATLGRRAANATFDESHRTDASRGVVFAMDLTPLVAADRFDPAGFVSDLLAGFSADALGRLRDRLPSAAQG